MIECSHSYFSLLEKASLGQLLVGNGSVMVGAKSKKRHSLQLGLNNAGADRRGAGVDPPVAGSRGEEGPQEVQRRVGKNQGIYRREHLAENK